MKGAQAPSSAAQDEMQYPQYPGDAVSAGLGGAIAPKAAPDTSDSSVQRGGNAGHRRAPGVRCPEPTSLGTDLARVAAPGTGVGGAGATCKKPYRTGCCAHTSTTGGALGEGLSSSKSKGSSGQNS